MIWDNYQKEIDAIAYDGFHKTMLIEKLCASTPLPRKSKIPMRAILVGSTIVLLLLCIPLYSLFNNHFNNRGEGQTEVVMSSKLEKIAIAPFSSDGGAGMSMSIEVPDDSYLKNNNPWFQGKVTSLPIYKNECFNDLSESSCGLQNEDLKKVVDHYAKVFALGKEISSDLEEQNIVYYEKGNIEAHRKGTVRIFLNVDEDLAKQFNKENTELASYEEANAYNLHYGELFKKQLELKNPTSFVSVNYLHDSEHKRNIPLWDMRIYDKKTNIKQAIDSFNFSSYRFEYLELNDQPILIINIDTYRKGEMMGDYPLITEEEAKEKFLQGNYDTLSIKPQLDIAFMDLIYYFDSTTEYMVPYYRIYAPLDKEEEEKAYIHRDSQGLQKFGVYYVCAVEDKYIERAVK